MVLGLCFKFKPRVVVVPLRGARDVAGGEMTLVQYRPMVGHHEHGKHETEHSPRDQHGMPKVMPQPADDYTGWRSDYLHGLDLSDRLELGKVIVLARVEDADGGRLWIDELPRPGSESQAGPPAIGGVMTTHTFLRVILEPVREKR